MERLVINKWIKPKCGGNSAYTSKNETLTFETEIRSFFYIFSNVCK